VKWDLPESGSIKPHTPWLTVWDLDTVTQQHEIQLENFRDRHDRIAISATAVAAGYCEKDKPLVTIKVWDRPKDDKGPIGPARTLTQREKAPGIPDQHFSCFTFTTDGQALAWGTREREGLIFTNTSGDGNQRSLPIRFNINEGYDYVALS